MNIVNMLHKIIILDCKSYGDTIFKTTLLHVIGFLSLRTKLSQSFEVTAVVLGTFQIAFNTTKVNIFLFIDNC